MKSRKASLANSFLLRSIPFAYGALGLCFSFFVWTKVEISVIKEDLHFYKKIYEKETSHFKEKFSGLNDRLDGIEDKEDILKGILQEMQADIKVIKYEIGINGQYKRKRK